MELLKKQGITKLSRSKREDNLKGFFCHGKSALSSPILGYVLEVAAAHRDLSTSRRIQLRCHCRASTPSVHTDVRSIDDERDTG